MIIETKINKVIFELDSPKEVYVNLHNDEVPEMIVDYQRVCREEIDYIYNNLSFVSVIYVVGVISAMKSMYNEFTFSEGNCGCEREVQVQMRSMEKFIPLKISTENGKDFEVVWEADD